MGEKIKPQVYDICKNEQWPQNALQALCAFVLKSGHPHINLYAAIRCREMARKVLTRV